MTPLNWIVIVWTLGTCCSTYYILHDWGKTEKEKTWIADHTKIVSPEALHVIMLVLTILISFFLWWAILAKALWSWLMFRFTIWVARGILDAFLNKKPGKKKLFARILNEITKMNENG